MKKVLALILALALGLALVACGGGSDEPDEPASSEETKTIASIVIDTPEEFDAGEVEGLDAYYQTEDGSNINLVIRGKDPTFSSVNEGLLVAAVESALKKQLGEDIELVVNYFTTNEVAGYPGYQLCYHLTYQGIGISQLVVGIDADKTYTVTYTDFSDGSWQDAFKASADGLKFEYE